MISAFKHIRLSGYNLLPQSVDGQTRLTLNSSGVAYFSELSTASCVLNTKIDAFSDTFQSFVNNLDNTYATDASVTTVANNLATTGSTLQTNINTVATNLATTGAANLARINSLSGTLNSDYVKKATQQQFIVTLPLGVESTGISFPVAFASIPNSVQVTFEPSTYVTYMVAVKNRTTAGFTAEFSDVLFEAENKLNVFASV